MAGFQIAFQAETKYIQFSLSAVGSNSEAGKGGAVGVSIGPCTKLPCDYPTQDGPLNGTHIISQKIFDGAFANQRVPISFTDFWGVLTVHQWYWIDVNWNVASGGNFTLSQITFCIEQV
jgi:hypothetical protein